jgi:YebC/PmpR family DNA-binding regulatory protein
MGRAFQNRKESIAKTSDQKSKIYSKYGREIYVLAKQGGSDPEGNLSLRSILDRAKKDQVPSHVIEKALKKAEGGGGENFDRARYEGFGPGNCTVIVDCLTDNPNRTFGDVRQAFTKTKTKIGTQGSVAHMFDHSAIFSFKGDDEEAALEALMMADVDVSDIECEDGVINVFCPQQDFFKAKQALKDAFEGIEFDTEEIQFIPHATLSLEGDDAELFDKFLNMLNDLDDVQRVYHNVV